VQSASRPKTTKLRGNVFIRAKFSNTPRKHARPMVINGNQDAFPALAGAAGSALVTVFGQTIPRGILEIGGLRNL
jgi:hypothetical protein